MASSTNLHLWMAEPLLARRGAILRRMFGATSIYLDGVLLLVLCDSEQPWNGLLFPAERPQHPSILASFPWLVPHPILPKWLYLSVEDEQFEPHGLSLIERIVQGDNRFGVIPPPKKKKKASARKSPPRPGPDGRPPHLI